MLFFSDVREFPDYFLFCIMWLIYVFSIARMEFGMEVNQIVEGVRLYLMKFIFKILNEIQFFQKCRKNSILHNTTASLYVIDFTTGGIFHI